MLFLTISDALRCWCLISLYLRALVSVTYTILAKVELSLLRALGILPTSLTSPHCNLPCKYHDQHVWYCDRWIYLQRPKCVSSICDYTDLFLQGPHLTPFKISLLIIGFKCTGIMILLSNALACLNQIA